VACRPAIISTVLGSLGSSPPGWSRPQVSRRRYTGGREILSTRVELRRQQFMGVWRSGSACRLQRRGHRFEPCHAHQTDQQVRTCATQVRVSLSAASGSAGPSLVRQGLLIRASETARAAHQGRPAGGRLRRPSSRRQHQGGRWEPAPPSRQPSYIPKGRCRFTPTVQLGGEEQPGMHHDSACRPATLTSTGHSPTAAGGRRGTPPASQSSPGPGRAGRCRAGRLRSVSWPVRRRTCRPPPDP
jgi:hypothetical protein